MTWLAFLRFPLALQFGDANADLVMKSGIMHIVAHDKGKPAENRGRKTTGLRDEILGQRGNRSEQALQTNSYSKALVQAYGPKSRLCLANRRTD